MIIDREMKSIIVESFKMIHSNKDEIIDLNHSNAEIMKSLCDKLQISLKDKKAKSAISGAYRYWVKQQSNESELDFIVAIIEQIV